MKQFIRYWTSFSGRIGRLQYLLRGLLLIALFSLITALSALGWGFVGAHTASKEVMLAISCVFAFIVLSLFIFLIISSFSLAARRLHDINYSAWWVVAISAWQLLMHIASNSAPFVALLGLIPAFILLFAPGTKGKNRFGPEPISKKQLKGSNSDGVQ